MKKVKMFFVDHPVIAWNATGIILAIFTHWMVWVIFFVVSLVTYAKRVKQLRIERKVAIIKEVESYISEIKEQKRLPQVSSSLFLASGEYAFLQEKTNLKETRAIRTSSGGFGGFRVAKGITVGGWSGSSESHREWRLLDSGELVLTNKKIVFRGGKENRTIPIDKVIGLEVYANGMEVAVEGRTKSIAFSVKNPYIWNIAISILRSGRNPLDLKGDELNIQLQ